MRSAPTTDHRAHPIELYGLLSDRVRVVNRETVPIDVQQDIEREVQLSTNASNRAHQRWNVVLAAAVCFVGAWTAIQIVTGVTIARWQAALLTAVAVVLLTLFTMPMRRAHFHRRYAPSIVDAFLSRRRCPACGYDLAGLDPDGADGCTVCPECGAAWKLPSRA